MYDFLSVCHCNIPIVPLSSYLTFRNAVTLKSGSGITQGYCSWRHSICRIGLGAYSPSIVTIAISCIVSEAKRDIGWKSRFYTPFYIAIRIRLVRVMNSNPVWKERLWIILRAVCFSTEPDQCPSMWCKHILQNVFCLFTAHARYGQTDRRKGDLNSGAYHVTLLKVTKA